MRAILMAAGVGSRISRHVDKPKSTLEVDGVPLIRRTVDMLISKGVEVAVVIGFKGDQVRKALEGCDVRFYENPFYRVTNSMASLWFARDFLEGEDTLLANADVFWGEGLFERLVSGDDDIVMLADESRVEVGDYFFDVRGDLLVNYGKDLPLEDRTTEYVGMAMIKGGVIPEFRRHLEEMVSQERYDLWWENVLYEYISAIPVHVRDVSDLFWAEIDYIDDYSRILDYVRTGDLSVKVRTERIRGRPSRTARR